MAKAKGSTHGGKPASVARTGKRKIMMTEKAKADDADDSQEETGKEKATKGKKKKHVKAAEDDSSEEEESNKVEYVPQNTFCKLLAILTITAQHRQTLILILNHLLWITEIISEKLYFGKWPGEARS
jgi:hypothetical protein